MIQNILDGIFILSPWSCPRDGTGVLSGAGDAQGGSKKKIFKHGHVAYQIEEDAQQNKLQVKFSS